MRERLRGLRAWMLAVTGLICGLLLGTPLVAIATWGSPPEARSRVLAVPDGTAVDATHPLPVQALGASGLAWTGATGAAVPAGAAYVGGAGSTGNLTGLPLQDCDTGVGVIDRLGGPIVLPGAGVTTLVGAGAAGDPLPISDDGGALTVDGAVTVATSSAAAAASIQLVDTDTGVGTIDRLGTAIVLPGAGNTTLVGAGAAGEPMPVSDDGGSLSIDVGGTAPDLAAGAVGAGTLRVTQGGLASAACVNVDVAAANTAVIGALATRQAVQICNVDPTLDDEAVINVGAASAAGVTLNAPLAAGQRGDCMVWPTTSAIVGQSQGAVATVTLNVCYW